MDFTYSENQNMLAESINRFLTSRYDLPTRKALLGDAAGTLALWQELVELGWIGARCLCGDGGVGAASGDCALSDQRDPMRRDYRIAT